MFILALPEGCSMLWGGLFICIQKAQVPKVNTGFDI